MSHDAQNSDNKIIYHMSDEFLQNVAPSLRFKMEFLGKFLRFVTFAVIRVPTTTPRTTGMPYSETKIYEVCKVFHNFVVVLRVIRENRCIENYYDCFIVGLILYLYSRELLNTDGINRMCPQPTYFERLMLYQLELRI